MPAHGLAVEPDLAGDGRDGVTLVLQVVDQDDRERLVSPPLLVGLRRRSWRQRWTRVSTANGGHSVARIDAATAQVSPLERRGEALDLPADAGASVSVAQVARRHALNANLIFKCHRKAGLPAGSVRGEPDRAAASGLLWLRCHLPSADAVAPDRAGTPRTRPARPCAGRQIWRSLAALPAEPDFRA
jgi:hypothetical protein